MTVCEELIKINSKFLVKTHNIIILKIYVTLTHLQQEEAIKLIPKTVI